VALKNELSASYQTEILTLNFDVQDNEAVQNALDSLPAAWKKIDVLVNNAGLSLGLDPIQSANLADWEQMIDTNVKGLLYMSRLVIPMLMANKQGHIVNISSIAGKEVYANGNVYCASKFAVDALNKGMRIELAESGIRVTSINPGAVNTEFSLVRFHGDAERAEKVYEGFDPLMAQDIADAVYYAISRPAHVNINEMIIMPTAQPVASIIHRKSN
jgi:NADP-dependent 3-hydroxy acid dehydrogenase YdfG